MLLGTPFWLISLDLSKAFARVDWQALWTALETHGVSQHLLSILPLFYNKQLGQVITDTAESRGCDIHRGVRQGCVLSPRLFCSVLEWPLHIRTQAGLTAWRPSSAQRLNWMRPPRSYPSMQGQPMTRYRVPQTQKWLGCILTAQGSKLHHVDVKHHLQQASKAFFANHWILKDHQVSIATRLKYFDKVVTTVACFAAGHRALYKNDLVNMDVSYRKLCRQIVGSPPGTNWSLEWHEILPRWNERVEHFAALAVVKSWSQCACTHY